MSAARIPISLHHPIQFVALKGCGLNHDRFRQFLHAREQAAYQRGRADGEAALSEQLINQRNDVAALQNGVFARLEQSMAQVHDDCRRGLVELALETARRLVAGLPITASIVEAAIEEALSEIDENTDYHVYLHPDDLALLHQINSPLRTASGAGQRVHLHRDPDISRGGCVVRTQFGVVDAQRETKFQMLQQALAS